MLEHEADQIEERIAVLSTIARRIRRGTKALEREPMGHDEILARAEVLINQSRDLVTGARDLIATMRGALDRYARESRIEG